MHTDNLILISALMLVLSLVGALAFCKPEKKPQAFWHFLLIGVYSTLFFYFYISQSGGGSALVWWFYWLMSALIQAFVLVVQLLRRSKKK